MSFFNKTTSTYSRRGVTFRKFLTGLFFSASLIIVCVWLSVRLFFPVSLDESVRVTIPEGTSITGAAYILHTNGLIRSVEVFKTWYRFRDYSVKAGTYLFEEGNYTISEIIHRLHMSDYGEVFLVVTIPEGSTNQGIAQILSSAGFEHFSSDGFLSLAESYEGYLFPDTYHFLPDFSAQDIFNILRKNFDTRVVLGLAQEFEQNKRSLQDVVIMASILEKEASLDYKEKQMVSGILWKRIDRGMLLQVDAPFLYYQGKGSHQLSITDLRTDHEYNTYTRLGLTPTPIGNPGIASIRAALNPISSEYWYYLHDTSGKIHYGVTHDDHIRNKQRYLR